MARPSRCVYHVLGSHIRGLVLFSVQIQVKRPPLYRFSCLGLTVLLNAQRRGNKACTYKLLSLPKYVILYIKRFTKNNFFLEKNPTIVNFPVKNLELRDCMYCSVHDAPYGVIWKTDTFGRRWVSYSLHHSGVQMWKEGRI